MTFREALERRVLVFDGAMGTQIQGHQLKAAEFGGKEGANDLLTLTRPDLIEAIHGRYFAVGCDVVETNTFGSSRLKLDEYGLGHRAYEVNFRAAVAARRAAERHATPDQPRFVAGSIGPTGMLPSASDPALSNITGDALERIFFEQARGLIDGGVDAVIIETQQDLLELRAAVIAVDAYRREALKDVFIIAQPTLIDANGRMLLGTEVGGALAALERLPLDAIGLNCSTGPAEMRESVRYLGEHCSHYVSCLPNAGMPENENGHAVYKLSPDALAAALAEFVRDFGVDLVGGCCGTTPEHLRRVVEELRKVSAPRRKRPAPAPELASAMKAVPLDLQPRPLVVGERVNSQGSKKVKELLLADDYAGILRIARDQVEGGAHVLDVCVALNEREDEAAQMRTLVKLLAQAVDAPLMIDSTEADVVEAALKVHPGRCIVNSVNLEKSGERVKKVLPLVKRYGAAVVAMTIDEKGMAQTAERKAEIARRTVAVAKEYGVPPDALVFDPLTFTLATGGEEYRHSAIETLEGIKRIKAENPGVFTCLGVSNVSFGLSKPTREVVNSVFLYHAVQAGLDLAIVNPKDIKGYQEIGAEERALAEDVVFDRRPDALQRLIEHFAGKTATSAVPVEELFAGKTAEERLHLHILHRRPEGVEALIDEALTRHTPVDVLNTVLLPAMKDVGDRFGAGELILPFVLQSAEVMKRAVAQLENYLDKIEGYTKGTVVIATVFGDVHDIGKSLVNTILTNNGYTVIDLGKQVPVDTIINAAIENEADAIGLSALLVSTSKQMPTCVQELHERGLEFPVLIGGAAINRDFGRRILYPKGKESDEIYEPGVYYCKDAFAGLATVDQLIDADAREGIVKKFRDEARQLREKPEVVDDSPPVTDDSVRSDVRTDAPIPEPPFWGVRDVEPDLDDLYPYLDRHVLFKLHWGGRGVKGEEWERLVSEDFEPRLERMWREQDYLHPKARLGYFPCNADGNELIVYDPDNPDVELERLVFPRQPKHDRICLTDFFRPVGSGERDVVALQGVTVGPEVTELIQKLEKDGEFAEQLFTHGLGVQAAEGLAEWLHSEVRRSYGIDLDQGRRYSWGYPACPEQSEHEKVWRLLDLEQIGMTLSDGYAVMPEQSTVAI
ncbi:MAG: methionine synthase, partial [Anaeromyxobacteraceae bacterium]